MRARSTSCAAAAARERLRRPHGRRPGPLRAISARGERPRRRPAPLTEQPLVSIVIPYYRLDQFVEQAVRLGRGAELPADRDDHRQRRLAARRRPDARAARRALRPDRADQVNSGSRPPATPDRARARSLRHVLRRRRHDRAVVHRALVEVLERQPAASPYVTAWPATLTARSSPGAGPSTSTGRSATGPRSPTAATSPATRRRCSAATCSPPGRLRPRADLVRGLGAVPAHARARADRDRDPRASARIPDTRQVDAAPDRGAQPGADRGRDPSLDQEEGMRWTPPHA